jgi:hypothetical protein
VQEIEQQLENESDLDFQGLLSDKVIYIRGHWVPLVHANRVSDKEQALVELAQNTILLHSILEYKWLMSTTTINEGTKECRNRFAVDTGTPRLKPLILSSPYPVESQGEHMFISPITVQPATMEQDVKKLEADAGASAHLTREEDVHQEDAHHAKTTDASDHNNNTKSESLSNSTGDASALSDNMKSEHVEAACKTGMQVTREPKNPVEGESWTPEARINKDTFINSNCRDKESDCSIESDTEDDEMDTDAFIGASVKNKVEEGLSTRECSIKSDGTAVEENAVNEKETIDEEAIDSDEANNNEESGHLKVPPDKVLSPVAAGLDRGGGKPPHNNETHQSRSFDGPEATKRYIEH